MRRINTLSKAVDLFGIGKHGFIDGNKWDGTRATELNASLFNSWQEELASLIETEGIALSDDDNNQLIAATKSWGSRIVTDGGGAVRTLKSKIGDRLDIRDFSGIDLSGANDSGGGLAKAFAESALLGETLHSPAGTLVTSSKVSIPEGVSFHGPHMFGRQGNKLILHIAHSGVGFEMRGAGGSRQLKGFATKRDQPGVGSGAYTPNLDIDFDFDIVSAEDIVFEDVLLLNPTRGIRQRSDGVNGGGGRVSVTRLGMQPLLTGIEIQCSYDVMRMNTVHCWPYWNQDTKVRDWMLDNMVAFRSMRNDNPVVSNLFSIWHKRAISIEQFAGSGAFAPPGTTYKAKFIGCDFDIGAQGYYVDAAASNHTAHFVSPSFQGPDIPRVTPLVEIAGTDCAVTMTAPRFSNAGGHAAKLSGSGSLTLISPVVDNYSLAEAGYEVFFASNPGSLIDMIGSTDHIASGGVSLGEVFGGLGNFSGELWRPYVPQVSTQIGAISALGPVSGFYKMIGRTVSYSVSIAIATNGTGAGDVRVRLPLVPNADAQGFGREVGITGKALSVTMSTGGVDALVSNYDNTYPGMSGAVLVITGEYRI